jgi:hypothetical protein
MVRGAPGLPNGDPAIPALTRCGYGVRARGGRIEGVALAGVRGPDPRDGVLPHFDQCLRARVPGDQRRRAGNA